MTEKCGQNHIWPWELYRYKHLPLAPPPPYWVTHRETAKIGSINAKIGSINATIIVL
jgi:hypothetical protein